MGESWANRLGCRQWGVHLPHVAGVTGVCTHLHAMPLSACSALIFTFSSSRPCPCHPRASPGQWGVGAQSIVLSGGYEDDRDEGDWFLFCGAHISVPPAPLLPLHRSRTIGLPQTPLTTITRPKPRRLRRQGAQEAQRPSAHLLVPPGSRSEVQGSHTTQRGDAAVLHTRPARARRAHKPGAVTQRRCELPFFAAPFILQRELTN